MQHCPRCGALNQSSEFVCVACGRLLAVECPQCGSRSAPSCRFCQACGRILPGQDDDPIAEMVRTERVSARVFPRRSYFMAGIGLFVLILLYVSGILQGHPWLSVVTMAGFAGLALVGLWDLVRWAMDMIEESRAEPTRKTVAENELAETLTEMGPDPLGAMGSFADAEQDGQQQTGMVSSMVAGGIEPLRPAPMQTEAAANSVPDQPAPPMTSEQSGTRDIADGNISSTHDIATKAAPIEARTEADPASGDSVEDANDASPDAVLARARRAETLTQFLTEGVSEELAQVEARLRKHPRNRSLLFRQAHLLDERGDRDKAIATMETCLNLGAVTPEMQLFYGQLLRSAGRLDDAEATFCAALELNPFFGKAHYQLGCLFRAQKRLAEAKAQLQKCIQLAPEDAYAHYQLGMVYRDLGEVRFAELELKRATQLNPHDSYGFSQLALVHKQQGQLDAAIRSFSQALSIKPNDAFVLERLAEVLVTKGELERAAGLYQEALSHQFHPEPTTMMALARVLIDAKQPQQVEAILTEVARVTPDDAELFLLRGKYAILQNDRDAAVRELLGYVARKPDNWEAWVSLGRIYQELAMVDQAVESFIRASTSAPDQAGIWNAIGVLEAQRGRDEAALKAFRQALSYDYTDTKIQTHYRALYKKVEASCQDVIKRAQATLQEDAVNEMAYLEIGRAHEALEQHNEALGTYQRLLAVDHGSVPGLMAYANLLVRLGRLRLAMRCYKEILKLVPNHLDALLASARGKMSLGFVNDALRDALAAEKLAARDARVHYLLGGIYFAKGMAPRALKEYEAAAQSQGDPEVVRWSELMRRRLQAQIAAGNAAA